tara:strand:+ start:7076 stop:7894 length:819 start_codon:yes stop_codon:yes gene_type:complete
MTNVPKFTAGQPLPINQTNWNQIADATNHVNRTRTTKMAQRPVASSSQSLVVKLKNTGESSIGAREAVSIQTPLLDTTGMSASDPAVIKATSQFAVTGDIAKFQVGDATTAAQAINIGISKNAIAAGDIGDVVVGGLAYAKINISSADDVIARASNVAGILDGTTVGCAGCRIIAKPVGTGTQICLVDVGMYQSPYATVYRCLLTTTLADTDTTVAVDNLTAMNGQPVPTYYSAAATATVNNPFGLHGNDNDICMISWNNTADAFDLIQVKC